MSSMLDWALFYLSQGLPIFPVEGKIPVIKWKELQERLPSEEEIKEWWGRWPEADIGMVTGPISSRLVLDIDGDDGRRSMGNREVGSTPCVQTRRGLQFHFRFPESATYKTTLAGILPGVDSRGSGGYCKLPPSRYSDNSGRYTWQSEARLAEAPQWFLDLLIEKAKPRVVTSSDTSWLQEKLNEMSPDSHNRDHTFTSIAGSLRSRGYSAKDMYILLEPHAIAVDFPLNELQKVCDSVGSYAPKVSNEASEDFSSFLEHEESVDWLVPGIIAKNSIGFVAGLPETSKTWLTMDLALTAASGKGYWLGKFSVKQSKVLFIDQERFKGETQRRFRALANERGIAASDLNGKLQVKCGTTIRLNQQQSYDGFRHELTEYRPDLVIIDSFATFHTATENDRTEIQKVLERIKQLRTEFGCTFLFINHESKMALYHEPGEEAKAPSMAEMMGSIAVPAAAEMMLTVRRRDASTCVIYNTKNTLAPTVQPFSVSVEDMDESRSRIRVRAF